MGVPPALSCVVLSLEVPIEPQAIATALAKVLLDKKAGDVAILDMCELVDYTDVFVLCTARNRRHVAALAEDVRAMAKHELGLQCLGIEGLPTARWVLVDFGSVVVHIFDEPLRPFYNLDGLWGDAPRLPVPEVPMGDDDEADPTAEVDPHP
jgi:ribosome-associated protein